MRIINVPTIIEPPSNLSHIPLLGDFIKNHQVNLMFNVDVINSSAREMTLKLELRDPPYSGRSGMRGALGYVVDCAARMSALHLIGQCDLSEYEMAFHAQFTGETLITTAQVESARFQCATYHCAIYIEHDGRTTLMAESHGTLLKTDL